MEEKQKGPEGKQTGGLQGGQAIGACCLFKIRPPRASNEERLLLPAHSIDDDGTSRRLAGNWPEG